MKSITSSTTTTTTTLLLLAGIAIATPSSAGTLRRRTQTTLPEDPNKPQDPPRAHDDFYDVYEGGYLEVQASGFLGNDDHESDKSSIYRSQRSTSGMKGKVNTHSNGSFEYTAPERCWTGDDVFHYNAAYERYPDLESNQARVTIRVKQDPHRPQRPQPADDFYELYEGTRIDIKASSNSGLLWNDIGGDLMYIPKDSIRKHDGWQGVVKVDPDGSFKYTADLGQEPGDYKFDYGNCQEGWEQCVDCASGTVTLRVHRHPDRPTNPPTPVHSGYEVEQGERLDVPAEFGVLSNDQYDTRYTLFVEKYSYDGKADFKVRDDGSLRYENKKDEAFLGTDPFEYRACYKEWPDLCYTGTGSVLVKPAVPSSDDSNSRRGVATAYFVKWDASDDKDDAPECDEPIEPRLYLSCEGEGELSLLDIGDRPNDNSNCLRINGVWSCIPTNSGQIYVECRDGRATNAANRQLHVDLVSEPVNCQPNHLTTTYHVGTMLTLCNNDWIYQGMNCVGGDLLENNHQQDPNQPPLCYGTDISVGPTSQPQPITMTSINHEQCLYV